MLCDECLALDPAEKSPKRKNEFVQRTINMQNPTTSMGDAVINSPSNKPGKPTTQQMIEKLALKLDVNTMTISALKVSIDSMDDTVTQAKEVVAESMRVNTENVSSLKTSLEQTQNLVQSVKKPSFSSFLKGPKPTNDRKGVETPRTSKGQRPARDKKIETPSVAGTSTKTIGKPLTPNKPRPRIIRKLPEKAIWLGRLHRDTTEEELLEYIKNECRVANMDQLEVRRLVKKDRDISEYSFISFKVACSAELFEELMDVKKWPSYCLIREFKIDMGPSIGTQLTHGGTQKNESKNEFSTTNENQTQQEASDMQIS